MSGRLTILPKKTYCPWKPENVERVLRDERLERERQQAASVRSLGDEDDARRRRRRYDEGGHINLFPEAKDAELRLLTGGRTKSKATTSLDAVKVLPPAPLGGDEAAKRKSGNVPFYMRQSSEGRGKYDNIRESSFRLGDNRTNCVRSDEITGKIMNDQYAKREDYRKDKLDPMSRFYVDFPDPSRNITGRVAAGASALSKRESHDSVTYNTQSETTKARDIVGRQHELSRDEGRTRRHHESKRRRRRRDDSSVQSSSSITSSSSHASAADDAYRSRNTSNGRHRKRHKSRRHREGPSAGSGDKQRHRNRSSERKIGDESRKHRHRQRHDCEQKSHGKSSDRRDTVW